MKRLLALFTALLLSSVLLVACGDEEDENNGDLNGGFSVGHDPAVSDPVWD